MNHIMEQITVVALAIISLAILAVLVSKNANTVGVIGATSKSFTDALRAATGPVSGSFGGI